MERTRDTARRTAASVRSDGTQNHRTGWSLTRRPSGGTKRAAKPQHAVTTAAVLLHRADRSRPVTIRGRSPAPTHHEQEQPRRDHGLRTREEQPQSPTKPAVAIRMRRAIGCRSVRPTCRRAWDPLGEAASISSSLLFVVSARFGRLGGERCPTTIIGRRFRNRRPPPTTGGADVTDQRALAISRERSGRTPPNRRSTRSTALPRRTIAPLATASCRRRPRPAGCCHTESRSSGVPGNADTARSRPGNRSAPPSGRRHRPRAAERRNVQASLQSPCEPCTHRRASGTPLPKRHHSLIAS